ncbi:transferrin-binding protein-like solute binding protein [Sphingorhabdus wooponensis]|uniref:transferrin-binding protein-like solute binding protein n=1 Tax=Sphingorhabdus wooponensis TaxID=940136 RepID=UPI001C8B3AAA
MTYGAWGGKTATGGLSNGFHGGSVTPSGSVPTSGSVTYTGAAVGYYADEGGNRIREFTDRVTLAANFGSRSLLFSAPGIVGTLTYSSGSSTFSGPISSNTNFGWSGTATGSFYGPGAQEVAGTFFMRSIFGTCSPGCQFVGAFGAKRP